MRATNALFSGMTFALTLFLAPCTGWGQTSPYRGLWVGSAALTAVNEVSVPFDENNVAIAPVPEVPTASFDRADLRLILHVNGAGQAFLLKDVAILNRAQGQDTNGLALVPENRDVALVTDPRLYSTFPPQPAMRYASAVFDFGDAKATEALDAMVEEATLQAVAFTTNGSLSVDTQGEQVQARNDAIAIIEPLLGDIAVRANAAEVFQGFLLLFDTTAINKLIVNTSDPVVVDLVDAANLIRDSSFYHDTRPIDMVDAVVAAINGAASSNRSVAAHLTASSYADVANLYQRFISSSAMGDMIAAAAIEAGTAAKLPGATAASIELSMRSLPETVSTLTNALQAKVQQYNDTRSVDAVNAVLAAMASNAVSNVALPVSDIQELSEQAGQSALAAAVARYPLLVIAPTYDYTEYVQTGTFTSTPPVAAYAAADAAIQERATNPLYTPQSLYAAAKIAATDALRTAYLAAARVMRTELPLTGTFAPGSGDPRFIIELNHPSDLGNPGLEGRIYLPESHPTNPFRHRRHPDHTLGYNIERLIRFDFDGAQGDSLEPSGFGVDKITGIYREEIFGLHKPLGPAPDTQPIGLRTEGRFELNRISTIDTLNTP